MRDGAEIRRKGLVDELLKCEDNHCTTRTKLHRKKARKIDRRHSTTASSLLPILNCEHLPRHHYFPLTPFCTTLTLNIFLRDTWSIPIPIVTTTKHLYNHGCPILLIPDLIHCRLQLHLHYQFSWLIRPMKHPPEEIRLCQGQHRPPRCLIS
ncbi:hypothetical protein BYT27DRAFT_6703397 [Phlegmacium glaucopus]|nr:hypothetical protein BYT27DRAFT_6703397 [Phlegmacium glaucopus]